MTRLGAVFARVWTAHSVSTFGDQLTLVALPFATYADTTSPLAVGIVASAEAVTALLFGIIAGAFVDRAPHRPVLVSTDLIRASTLAGLIVGGPSFPSLVVAAVILGVVRVVHDAAASAVVPEVVDERDLLSANGRLHASEAASTAIGPAVAGALLALGGASLAFGVDLATFVLSAALLAGLPAHIASAPDETTLGTVRHDVAEGVRALLSDRVMRLVVGQMAALNVVAVAAEAHFIPYAREVLGIGGFGIGAYFALGGSVAVATSLLSGRRSDASGVALVAGVAVFSAAVVVAGVAPSHASAAALYVAAGAGSALVVTHAITFRQRRFPIRLQGRVSMAVRAVVLTPMAVALLLGGWLAERASVETLYVTAGLIGLLAAGGGLAAGAASLRTEGPPAAEAAA